VILAASCHERLWLESRADQPSGIVGAGGTASAGRSGSGGSAGEAGPGGSGGSGGSGGESGSGAGSGGGGTGGCGDAGCSDVTTTPDGADAGSDSGACTDGGDGSCADAAPFCGDGNTNADRGEECDDRNRTLGDGCDDCRFSCVPGDSERGCGDLCADSAECEPATRRCIPQNPLPDGIACAPGNACKTGICQHSAPVGRLVRFDFTGFVYAVTGVSNEVHAGDQILGYFVFDPIHPDFESDPSSGSYRYDNASGEFELHVKVGKLHLVSAETDSFNAFSSEIGVRNEYFQQTDEYFVHCNEARGTAGQSHYASLSLTMTTNVNLDTLSSDGLPLVPPPLEKFETTKFELNLNDQGRLGSVYGHLTSLTHSY